MENKEINQNETINLPLKLENSEANSLNDVIICYWGIENEVEESDLKIHK